MEKTNNTHSVFTLTKPQGGYGKIILGINPVLIFELMCSFLLSRASVLSSLSPFGLGFYSAVFTKKMWVWHFVLSCVACLTSGTPIPGVYITAFVLATSVFAVVDTSAEKFLRPAICTMSFFVLKLFYICVSGFIWYSFFSLVLECVIMFFSSLIFSGALGVISRWGKRNFVTRGESLSTLGFLALVILELTNSFGRFGSDLSGICSVLVIYIFACGGINGSAVIMGVVLGFVGIMHSGDMSTPWISYGFGALLASFMSFYGKGGIVLGFICANTALSLVVSSAPDIALSLRDSIIAGVIFAFIPRKFTSYVSVIFSGGTHIDTMDMSVSGKMQKNMKQNLSEMSKNFRELSGLYMSSASTKNLGKDYIMSRFKSVTDSACMGCASKSACFKNKNSKGYKHMSEMLETAFRNGKISVHTMPAEFKNHCRRCDSFAEKFNSVCEIIKTEKQWITKLGDSRRLISDQLMAVAETLDAQAMKCNLRFDALLEENIRSCFDMEMLYPSGVIAQSDDEGNLYIEVSYNEKKVTDKTQELTLSVVSRACRRNLSISSAMHRRSEIVYSLFPAPKYSITAGFASKPKSGEEISGDSFRLINKNGNKVTLVLSDGMGSGESAARQSRKTVDLTEKFIRSGFDSETAVRLINSSLLLESSRDMFSTVDMCEVNTDDSSIRFTKLGAANSYVKTDESVACIKGSGLPAGILRETQAQKHLLPIEGDALIIMVSDGISDIGIKNNDESWLENLVASINSPNPQVMASKIMESALRAQSGEVHDDMTAVVLSVKKV